MKRIVEIKALDNGSHRNQTGDFIEIPEGWAVIPDDIETPNFPFGEIKTNKIDGVITVIDWTPGTIPEPEPTPEAEEKITLELTREQYDKLMSLLS